MIFTRNRFGSPATPEQLVPGDLFALDAGAVSWLGVRVADDERGWPMAMLLAGPDLHGERVPFPVDLRGISEGLGRLPVEHLSIEPPVGRPLPETGIAQHGSLVIDRRGEAWLVHRRRYRPRSQYLSLVTFRDGVPAPPVLAYPKWRIVLRDGHGEHDLVAFSPERAVGALTPG